MDERKAGRLRAARYRERQRAIREGREPPPTLKRGRRPKGAPPPEIEDAPPPGRPRLPPSGDLRLDELRAKRRGQAANARAKKQAPTPPEPEAPPELAPPETPDTPAAGWHLCGDGTVWRTRAGAVDWRAVVGGPHPVRCTRVVWRWVRLPQPVMVAGREVARVRRVPEKERGPWVGTLLPKRRG